MAEAESQSGNVHGQKMNQSWIIRFSKRKAADLGLLLSLPEGLCLTPHRIQKLGASLHTENRVPCGLLLVRRLGLGKRYLHQAYSCRSEKKHI